MPEISINVRVCENSLIFTSVLLCNSSPLRMPDCSKLIILDSRAFDPSGNKDCGRKRSGAIISSTSSAQVIG